LEGRRWHTNGVSVIFQQKLDVLLRACVRLGDGTAECEVEVRELVTVALYVALAAIRIIRPQLGQNATSAARLGVFLRTEVAHAARLAVARAVRLVYAAPDVILGRVSDAAGTPVARLVTIVARAALVTLLLTVGADVRQNDRVHVALGAPAVGGGRGVARVIAARVALVAIVGPENGGACVPAVGAAAPILAAGIAGRTELGRHVGAVGLEAAVEVGRRHGEVVACV
jgi:hypothetical protein